MVNMVLNKGTDYRIDECFDSRTKYGKFGSKTTTA